jgi:uncharacterized protein YkwD
MMRICLAGLALGAVALTGGLGQLSATESSTIAETTTLQATTLQAQAISQASSLEAMEQSIHTQINQYRRSKGLPALTIDSRITQQARAHSQAMANGKVPFSHQGFDKRVQAIGRAISYSSAAENVAQNQGFSNPARQSVQGWIKSPGHRKNIEGSYNLTGIGVARSSDGTYYFTQIFIRRGRSV